MSRLKSPEMPRRRKSKPGEKVLVQIRLERDAWERLERYRHQLSLERGYPLSQPEAILALLESLPKVPPKG